MFHPALLSRECTERMVQALTLVMAASCACHLSTHCPAAASTREQCPEAKPAARQLTAALSAPPPPPPPPPPLLLLPLLPLLPLCCLREGGTRGSKAPNELTGGGAARAVESEVTGWENGGEKPTRQRESICMVAMLMRLRGRKGEEGMGERGE